MAEPEVRSFNKPRPWSAELVDKFQEQDRKLEEHGGQLTSMGHDVQQIKNDQNLQTLALQGMQKEFAAHKQATDLIGKNVEKIVGLLGDETEDGDGGWKGTGLLGRVRRNEGQTGRMMRLYRQWIAWGGGFAASFALIGGATIASLWWAFGDAISKALRGH